MRAGVFSSLGHPSLPSRPHPGPPNDRALGAALAGRKLPNPCSSDSQSEPARWSSSPRRRRGRSSTTTSAPSTSCSACSARRRASPLASSRASTSPSSACAPRSCASSAPARRSPPARSRSRRARRRCSSSRCARRCRLGHNYIGTEHILLGLVRENEGVAARILLDFDADSEKIRNEVIRMLSGPGGRRQGGRPGRRRGRGRRGARARARSPRSCSTSSGAT